MEWTTVVAIILVVIAWYARKCAGLLLSILREMECLHEDFDRAHRSHDQAAMDMQVLMDEGIAKHMRKPSKEAEHWVNEALGLKSQEDRT
jgi:hypothetical protein